MPASSVLPGSFDVGYLTCVVVLNLVIPQCLGVDQIRYPVEIGGGRIAGIVRAAIVILDSESIASGVLGLALSRPSDMVELKSISQEA